MIYKETDRSLTMHLCPGLHVAAKIAIFRCLRKIAKIEKLALFWMLVAKIAKNCQLRFFAVLCHVNNHLSPEPVVMVVDLTKFAKIAKNRKSDYFSRYLRFLAVLCHVNVHLSRVHDHLSLKPVADFTKFEVSKKIFFFTCQFGISLST